MPATLVRNDRGEDCPEGQLTAEKVSCGNRSDWRQSADECSSARIAFRFRVSFPKRLSAHVWNESMYV
jgi:hypothetical protein